MALTKLQRDELAKLDLNMGGGFYHFASNVHRAELTKNKFLFIGLGGKGTQTVSALKTAIYKKVRIDLDADKPENVEYLVIDTDQKEFEKACSKTLDNIGLDASRETCMLYSATAAAALRENRVPDYIMAWKNPGLRANLQGNGANGIRQSSRYLLFSPDGFQDIKSKIEEKVTRLNNLVERDGELIVYVISGLGGGTGSGCVIDIPYIVREICSSSGYKPKLEGYLFLPDSYPMEVDFEHVYYNTYAALKEIDFYMNLSERDGTSFDATYVGGYEVRSTQNLFNVCNLITGSIAGKGRRMNPDRFSQQVVIDHILNLITKSELESGQFLISQFLDNDIPMVASKVKNLPNTVPRDAGYLYNVIGIGAISLPIEQILSYVGHNVMQRLLKVWDNHPDTQQISELIEAMNLYPSEQSDRILTLNGTGMIVYSKGMLSPTSEEVINGTTFQQVKRLWMTRNVEFGKSLDQASEQVLEEMLECFNRNMEAIFEDHTRGPLYAEAFLGNRASVEGEFSGFLQQLETNIWNQAEGLIAGAQSNQSMLKEEMARIEKKLGKKVFFKGSLIENYVELCVNYFQQETKITVYRRIESKLSELQAYVESRLKVYRDCCDSLAGLADVLERNFKSVMDGRVEVQEYRQNLLDLSRVDEGTLKVKRYLDELLDARDYRSLASAMARKIHEREAAFRDGEDFNPMEVYVSFLEESFREIPNATIEQMIRLKYGESQFENGVMEICRGLYQSSQVIFDPLPDFPLRSMSSMVYITVPKKAENLVSKVEAFARSQEARVAKSTDMNSIVWYTLICGVPLFSIGKIKEYEDAYERSAMPIGMHISETKERDWKKFPNLNNPMYWKQDNVRERKIIEEVSANTDLMLDWGMIQLPNGAGTQDKYYGIMPEIAEIQENTMTEFLNWYCTEMNRDTQTGYYKTGSYLFEHFCDFVGKRTISIYIPTIYESVDVPGLKRMLRLNWLVYQELVKALELYPPLERRVEEKSLIVVFHKLYIMGFIKKTSDFAIFTDVTGEETELLFLDDLPQRHQAFYHYFIFKSFSQKVRREMLEGLDEVIENYKHDPVQVEMSRKVRNALIQECSAVNEALKKVITKREFEKSGQSRLFEELKVFYKQLSELN